MLQCSVWTHHVRPWVPHRRSQQLRKTTREENSGISCAEVSHCFNPTFCWLPSALSYGASHSPFTDQGSSCAWTLTMTTTRIIIRICKSGAKRWVPCDFHSKVGNPKFSHSQECDIGSIFLRTGSIQRWTNMLKMFECSVKPTRSKPSSAEIRVWSCPNLKTFGPESNSIQSHFSCHLSKMLATILWSPV